jgi:hypothetical protein
MTYDLLVLAIVANIYNVIGSVLYDKRLEELSGEPYFAYERVTGLIWPPVYRAPRGAREMTMPVPRHWRKPSMHVPGALLGIAIAALYYAVLGHAEIGVETSLKAAGAGLLAAVVAGAVIGRVASPRAADWTQQQTDLSTTVALAAALGVALWAGAQWIVKGDPPVFAVFLPLWFTVQYLGHVAAFLSDQKKWSGAGDPLETPGLVTA